MQILICRSQILLQGQVASTNLPLFHSQWRQEAATETLQFRIPSTPAGSDGAFLAPHLEIHAAWLRCEHVGHFL